MAPNIITNYTAAQLAAGLSRTRQGVYQALSSLPATATKTVAGQKASAWRLDELPHSLRNELADAVQRRGFRSVEQLLADPPRPWQPPEPFAALPAHVQLEARKWNAALAGLLTRQHELPAAELKDLMVLECRRVFGREISEKTARAHFDLAAQRDNGFENWNRDDLYVPESAYAISPAPPRAVLQLQGLHRELNQVIASIKKHPRPTIADRELFFESAVDHFEKLCLAHPTRKEQRKIKQSLVHFLHSAVPAVSRGESALRRVLDRKLKNAREGKSNADQRAEKSGRRIQGVDFTKDLELIRDETVKRDGIWTLGYRFCYERLSQAWRQRWPLDLRKAKSRVPRIVLQTWSREMMNSLVDEYRSPWRARMNGPYIRGLNDIVPGDVWLADDMHSNSKLWLSLGDFWHTNERGKPVFIRPEGLFIMDRAANYFLHHLLIAGHYNSRHGLRLVKEAVHKVNGIARGFKLENGIWRSRWMVGDAVEKSPWGTPQTLGRFLDALTKNDIGVEGSEAGELAEPRGDISLNRAEFGLDIRHCLPRNPRGKAELETAFGIIQNMMRHKPTYLGHNERLDRMDRNRQALDDGIRRVAQGKEHPGNFAPSLVEFSGQLDETINEYNRLPQNGKLQGAAPAEVWADGITRHPLRELPPEVACLLGSHEKTKTVTQRGILLDVGGVRHPYADGAIAHLQGQDVRVLYHVDCPDLIHVRDPKTRQWIPVKENAAGQNFATDSELAAVNSRIHSFRKVAQTISGNIRHEVKSSLLNDALYPEQLKQDGNAIQQSLESHREEQQSAARKESQVRRLAGALGTSLSGKIRDVERVRQGLDLEEEALADIKALEDTSC